MTETLIISILGSGALSALIAGIFNLINNKLKNRSGVAHASQLTLYNDIEHLIDKTAARGYINGEELRHLLEMHECYHDELGGNGYLDAKMNMAKALPIKE